MHKKKSLALLISAAAISSAPTMAVEWSIDEIVVTAQKRAQSAQEVGVALTAFNGDDIKALGGGSPKDLAAQSPGLSATNSQSGGVPIFSVRGIGLDDYNLTNSSSVGVYIDQVFASSPAFLSFQMLDVAAVEVLKGPQGTLYGKNTTGGAITFVSNKPTEEFEASITASYGRFDETKVESYINGALSDSVRGRLAISTAQDGEYQKDIYTGKGYGDQDKVSARALLAIDLSDTADMLIDVHGGYDRSTPAAPVIAVDLLGLGSVNNGAHDARSVESDLDTTKDDKGWGSAITINTELSFATFTSITAYDEYDVDSYDNYDGRGHNPGVGISAGNLMDLRNFVTAEQVSQEFRLTSNDESDFTWIAGLNYSVERVKGTVGTNVTDSMPFFYNAPLAAGGFGTTAVITAEDAAVLSFSSADGWVDTEMEQEINSLGLYFHSETQLNEEFKLTMGLRYSEDEVEYESQVFDSSALADTVNELGLLAGGPFAGAALFFSGGLNYQALTPGSRALMASTDIDEKDNSITGKIALDYTPNDDWLFYASVATGYKGGRVYAGAVPSSAYLFYVDPEELTAYELGFKATLLDGLMQVNGAVFEYDYNDRQSLIIDQFQAAMLENIPEAELNGAEVDVQWRPLEGLDIKAGIAYLDSKVTKMPTALDSGTTPLSEADELSQAPEWSYNAVVSYEWELSSELMARAMMDYSWKDDQLASISDGQSRYGRVKSLGARFAISAADESWELALWGRNLTNENDATYAVTTFAGEAQAYLQKPATYGLDFTYNIQ